jgi:ribosomal protein S18 acetylase RimI-like enzyme
MVPRRDAGAPSHSASLRGRDMGLPLYGWTMPPVLETVFGDGVEIREVRDTERAAAGDATSRAYREFAPPGPSQFDEYLLRIADIAARSERAVVLVALHRGIVAGSVTLEIDHRFEHDSTEPLAPDEAHMRMLGVAPEHRGLGIARRLVVASAELAAQRGRTRLTLDTTAQMAFAQALYASLGFRRDGVRHTRSGLELLHYQATIPLEASAAPAATAGGRGW